ncbi:hypothetical protein B0H13DRAFT_1863108 [Mycena leptocephala]|nr:hypothetical protein B0H13DRAFT_1863108 [Mycena leptocephala]
MSSKMKIDPPSPWVMRGPATAPISDGSPGRCPQRAHPAGDPPHAPPAAEEEDQRLTRPSAVSPPNNLLAPPTTGTVKRRSFLPLDTPALSLNIPIPEAAAFVPGVTAPGGDADGLVGGAQAEMPDSGKPPAAREGAPTGGVGGDDGGVRSGMTRCSRARGGQPLRGWVGRRAYRALGAVSTTN